LREFGLRYERQDFDRAAGSRRTPRRVAQSRQSFFGLVHDD
jgi:hypothetical protein